MLISSPPPHVRQLVCERKQKDHFTALATQMKITWSSIRQQRRQLITCVAKVIEKQKKQQYMTLTYFRRRKAFLDA
jgi:hypothetical protein